MSYNEKNPTKKPANLLRGKIVNTGGPFKLAWHISIKVALCIGKAKRKANTKQIASQLLAATTTYFVLKQQRFREVTCMELQNSPPAFI